MRLEYTVNGKRHKVEGTDVMVYTRIGVVTMQENHIVSVGNFKELNLPYPSDEDFEAFVKDYIDVAMKHMLVPMGHAVLSSDVNHISGHTMQKIRDDCAMFYGRYHDQFDHILPEVAAKEFYEIRNDLLENSINYIDQRAKRYGKFRLYVDFDGKIYHMM